MGSCGLMSTEFQFYKVKRVLVMVAQPCESTYWHRTINLKMAKVVNVRL